MEHRASLSGAERELERLHNDIRRVIEAIKNGFAGPDLRAEWDALQERKTALQAKLESADEPPPLLHPDGGAVPEEGDRPPTGMPVIKLSPTTLARTSKLVQSHP
jgi:hypothetical protein